jgi:pseudaminic acid synthase
MASEMISIAGRAIGPGCAAYLVAEISANHHQEFEQAAALVREAARAGADAVKLQTYTAATMTLDSDAPLFRIGDGSPWAGRRLFDLYQEAHTPWEWHAPLQKIAANEGVALFSTPFDESAVDFLESLDVPAYKIASFELVDTPLLTRVARTRKPVILSTGMATADEIREAVAALRDAGCRDLALLRCASAYPARPGDVHLRAMQTLAAEFGVDVGLSDHSLDPVVAVAAVALGAAIVEKHLTLDRSMGGPDASFSLEPRELAELVRQVRTAEEAIGAGAGIPGPTEAERASLAFRRSLFVVEDIEAGEAFTRENVRALRPGDGLTPKHLDSVIGRRAAARIARGTPLRWDLVRT